MATFFVENSQAEGARLKAESEDLDSQTHTYRGIEFSFRGLPTLTDGKVKVMWSDWETKAMSRCLICGAGPKDMARRKSKKFKPNPNHFKFGIASLHTRINAFLWLCKGYLYQDIKAYSKTEEQAPLVKERMEELKVKMLEELGLPVFQCTPGLVSVSTYILFPFQFRLPIA